MLDFRAAIVTVERINLAVVLVEPEFTLPTAGSAILRQAERIFPTLPILLLAPRPDDAPLGYATFQFEPLLEVIEPDHIEWLDFALVEPDSDPPF